MAKGSGKQPRKKARIPKGAELHDASRAELLKFYREMLLIRRFEEKAGQMYGEGLIGGFCHLYIGQEAVVVGVQNCLRQGDSVITGYRDHGHMLSLGIEPKLVLAELTGRLGGISKGKGGSMHMFSTDHGFFGGHGIVGAPVPIGTGLAFAHKYNKSDRICVCYFGDGAANQGQVFEAFNMAKLWSLPVLYIIENNKYAMGTSLTRSTGAHELWKRGLGFNIPGKAVDGMNVLAVRKATGEAVDHVRAGKGPYLLEMQTYRYRGHSMSDPALYRSKDEVKKMKAENDPIDKLKRKLIEESYAGEDELKTIADEIKERITAAAAFAAESPEPGADGLFTDVYGESAA
ncbi:MAG TPA: pyruvate dehydrogenase (acetyl-transferring) E1 component subunit alpha [Sphingomonadales bacterium]|nr:pyruvate dehydrogenase (acetyl-transferring) E1 component subunit alpha [Sphingomonadales bacterium]